MMLGIGPRSPLWDPHRPLPEPLGPICEGSGERPASLRQIDGYPYGVCAVCGQTRMLRGDGRMRRHRERRGK